MIYLDTCILIYALEDLGLRGERTREAMREVQTTLAVSSLVLHECLVGPLRDGDVEKRRRFTAAYDSMIHVDMDRPVFVEAAELRARYGLKAQDSLHLAAAQLAGCEAFWTNDKRLASASRGLAIDVIGDDVRG